MESLMQDLQTMENMRREIEIGEEVKGETEPQKRVGKGHLQQTRRKTVQVKNDLHLMNKGSIQNICLREDKDFYSLCEDIKKKIRRNFKLVSFQYLRRGQETINQ